ncbi:MAG: hypothetical protein QOE80_1116 [Actinomycetota bacterium]|jgi:hypothetical protein|nr:hypothetical protein [Actinomycetota bacterium]
MVAVALLVGLPIQLGGLWLVSGDRLPEAVAIPAVLFVFPFLAVELIAAMLAEGVATASTGQKPSWSSSFGLAAGRADLVIVLAAQAAVLYVTFFTVAGAVAVVVWWSAATTVLVLEGFQPVQAISRSFRLMQRQMSRNLVALVGGWAVLYIPALSAAASLASTFRKDNSPGAVASLVPFSLAYVPVAPILAVLVVLTYLDGRAANESVTFHPG